MSAIDWLSRSVATPRGPAAPPAASIAPVSPGLGQEVIAVTPLADTTLDALGLVSAKRAGIPAGFWGNSPTPELAKLLESAPLPALPALQDLEITLLTTEFDPPLDADGTGRLYLARVDRLLEMGALDPALALLELPEHPRPEPFRRWFDVALLTGHEDDACTKMDAAPSIAPTFPARIFCLARGGDWDTAALSLVTGRALGHIDPEMSELLSRFLDPELADGADDLPLPQRPSPLVFRLMEAIGQPLPTTTLPLAFAQSDLRSNAGWKTRLDAAERLARAGAIDPNLLDGLYMERRPAASGGVWERVAAVQELSQALDAGDQDRIYEAIPLAWNRMAAAELEVPFARLYGARLAGLGLKGAAGATAFRLGLLSDDYRSVATARKPRDQSEAFLIGIAKGNTSGTVPTGRLGQAVAAGFAADAPRDPEDEAMIHAGRGAEVVLAAMTGIEDGARGDLRRVSLGLAELRRAGLEDWARQAALQLLLLERRG